MICHLTRYSPSGIYCCNSTKPNQYCHASQKHPPRCLNGLFECPDTAGGACCPEGSTCSEDGCIRYEMTSTNSVPITSTFRSTTEFPDTSIRDDEKYTIAVYKSSTSEPKADSTAANTPSTLSGFLAVTGPKTGEVAQGDTGAGPPIILPMTIPFCLVSMLGFVALGFASL
jgi:hypothetical protein